MKFLVSIALVGALASAGTAIAGPSKTTSINASVGAKGCGSAGTECGAGGGGSCLCFAPFWSFSGRANLSPPSGSFTFTGLYEEGYFPAGPVADPATYAGPFTYYRRLDLVFQAANGDELVLTASSSSTTAPSTTLADGGAVDGTWAVDPSRSTGRYARFTGAGTYSLSGSVDATYESFSAHVVGSLTFG